MTVIHHGPSNKFHQTYVMLLSDLVQDKRAVFNHRTNSNLQVVDGACFFKLDLSDCKLPMPAVRRYFPHIAAAETVWQFTGEQSPSLMDKHAPKLWNNFKNEVGIVENAYGYRWRNHFNRDQLELLIEQLRNDPSSRQMFVSTWDPAIDGLGNRALNTPCPVGFHISDIDSVIHMSVFMRSSDVFVGLPYDVMVYALTLDAIAASVGRMPGTLSFMLANAHLYDVNLEHAKEALARDDLRKVEPKEYESPLPGWSVNEILNNPHNYIELVRRNSLRVKLSPLKQEVTLVL